MVGAALIAAAHEPRAQEKAKAAGAKGLRIVGSIETGQELVQRFEVDDVFVGLTGNWLTEELAVATGGIDVFAADMNCTVPTLGATCAAHGTLLVPVSDLVGVARRRDADRVRRRPRPASRREQLIDLAIANYPQAQGAGPGDAAAAHRRRRRRLQHREHPRRPRRQPRPAARRDQERHAQGRLRPRELHHPARRRPGQPHRRHRQGAHQERRARAGDGLRQRRPAGRRPRDGRSQGARRPRPHRRLRAPRHPAGAQLRHLHRHRPHPAAGRRHRRRPRRRHLPTCRSWPPLPSTWSRRPPSTPWRRSPSACTRT